MAINLYSKDSIDSLLSAKLSISSLSNAATSTLNATAPTTGQALTFDGTDLVWATVGGGGGSASWGGITGTLSDQSDLWSALGGKVDLTGSSSFTVTEAGGTTTIYGGSIVLAAPYYASTMTYGNASITFPDSTTQSTAAIPGPTDNVRMADFIAANIFSQNTYTDSVGLNWGNPPKFVLTLGTSWGIYDTSAYSYHYAAYATGNTVYFAGTWAGGPWKVRVNGEDSTITIS